eukprot:Nk52_evm3s2485 gene=Nk52_evmTU3s2485
MKALFVIAFLVFCVALASVALGAPSSTKNVEDPWAEIMAAVDTVSVDEAGNELVEKAKVVLSSPRHNIRTPPSQRFIENNELKAFRNGTLHRRSDVTGQTVADTRNQLKSFGSVNTQADAVSVISLAKINALYAQKYADEKDQSTKFTRYESETYKPWGSPTSYSADLIVGPPMFTFINNNLYMTVELQKGSKITAKLTNGTEMVKDIVPGTPAVTSAPLTRVTGSSDDFSVALNINQTEWIVKLDIGKETVDPTFEGHVQKGLQSYFTSTFHDSDYILGTMILNPDQPGIIKGMNPKEFIMRTIEDAYGRSGNGFLVLMIQTDGAPLTDATANQIPTRFNMVPDGYDTALYLTNRALYNSIYLESFSPVVSGLRPVEVNRALTYTTGALQLGNLNQADECKVALFGGCQDTRKDHDIKTSGFSAVHSEDAHPQRLTIRATSTTEFKGCNALAYPGSRFLSCASVSTNGDFTNNLKFDFSLSNEIIDIQFSSDHKLEGDFGTSFWERLFGGSKEYIERKANEWGQTSANLIKNNPPKIASLNAFRLNRILFPQENIYSYKEVHSLTDLVLFGNTVSQ